MGSIWFGRLREAALGLLLGAGAFFVVGEELSRAEASVREEDPREDAFREWSRLLGRLEADAARGEGECRLLPDGVAFRGGPTYTWSARSGQVRRDDGRGAARVVAHGITAFEVHTTGKGPIVVTAEASRGRDAAYRRTVRLP